jgi:hypothetical protein
VAQATVAAEETEMAQATVAAEETEVAQATVAAEETEVAQATVAAGETKVAQTVTATVQITPTPEGVPTAPTSGFRERPVPLAPPNDSEQSGSVSVGLKWTWGGDLGADDLYSVRVWRRDGPPHEHCIHTRVLQPECEFDRRGDVLYPECRMERDFCWNVQVVRWSEEKNDWIQLSDNSEPQCFLIAERATPRPR